MCRGQSQFKSDDGFAGPSAQLRQLRPSAMRAVLAALALVALVAVLSDLSPRKMFAPVPAKVPTAASVPHGCLFDIWGVQRI